MDTKDDNTNKLFELYKKINDKMGIKLSDSKKNVLDNLINNLF